MSTMPAHIQLDLTDRQTRERAEHRREDRWVTTRLLAQVSTVDAVESSGGWYAQKALVGRRAYLTVRLPFAVGSLLNRVERAWRRLTA